MGVVNVTPDSFSDGGLFLDPKAAVAQGARLRAEGAAVLDVGGESTRPGAAEVLAEEEIARVEPVVWGLARAGARVSIDTSKLAVAEVALDAGATMVNDVTALRSDPGIAGLCAERDADLVLMHMLGTPRTMQQDPTYEDVVDEVRGFLEERLELAVAAGVPESRVWLDPGIGFGKTLEHNLELLRRLDELVALGRPVLVGASRKSFIGKIDGSEVSERLGGTIAASVLAARAGAAALRVHDVAEMAQALRMAAAIESPGSWERPGPAPAAGDVPSR
ncbi:MAG: dihydropteroate synthase [Solirubrobacterales bacterium]